MEERKSELSGGVKRPELKPGWLARSAAESRRTIISKNTPMQLVALGKDVTLPLRGQDVQNLFEDMTEHFYAWTGLSLRDYVTSDNDRARLTYCQICSDTKVLLLPDTDDLCVKLNTKITIPCAHCNPEGFKEYQTARRKLLDNVGKVEETSESP